MLALCLIYRQSLNQEPYEETSVSVLEGVCCWASFIPRSSSSIEEFEQVHWLLFPKVLNIWKFQLQNIIVFIIWYP